VLKPLAEGERYDLVLDLRPRLLRVQCKWAVRRRGVVEITLKTNRRVRDGFKSTTYSAEQIDAVGAYCAELDRCYLLPVAVIAGRQAIYLRLLPSGNNQASGINWARDYELGAIAQLGERRTGSAEVAGSSPASSTATR
jgi:PD-(D/E)XK endonuclease